MNNMQKFIDIIMHRFVYVIEDNNLDEIYLQPEGDHVNMVVILGDNYVGKTSEFTNIKIKLHHIVADIENLNVAKVYPATNNFEPDRTFTKIWTKKSGYIAK